jgi:hypothetical protein
MTAPVSLPGQLGTHLADHDTMGRLRLSGGGSGVVLGINRHSAPVAARLFRPGRPTSVVFVGGLRCAQLLVYRAIAVGAQANVQSGRQGAWREISRAVPPPSIRFTAPGAPLDVPATPFSPQMLVNDAGQTGHRQEAHSGWQATLTVLDELNTWDVEALGRADLVLMQPLSPAEAKTAAGALGLHDVEQWLTKLRADMLTLVSTGTPSWVVLAATAAETQVVGSPNRR